MRQIVLASFLASLLSTGLAFASDHIDGPVTTKLRLADLTDLYAFPTPGKPGFLSVVLNAYPVVPVKGHFSDKITHSLYLRKAAVKGSGERFFFETSEEVKLTCTFETPAETENHSVTCKGSNGTEATSKYGQVSDLAAGAAFRVFAGMRSDPFFFNAFWAKGAAEKGKIGKAKNIDIMSHTNILSLAFEIDLSKMFKNGASLIALNAETTTQEGGVEKRLDRVGRPEITNVSMVAHEGDADLRDGFNLDRPFQVQAANQQSYKERLAKNISFFDKIDTKQNWKDGERDTMAALLADDFLVVDVSKPCGEPAFLEIERAILQHKEFKTCGGRKLTDDIMDDLFSLYIGGLNGARIRDGVDKPFKAVSDSFPYTAEPDLTVLGKTQAAAKRLLMGL